MSDLDEGEMRHGKGGERDGELLLYDFFKHLTSLSVLLLGGVLILAPDSNASDVAPEMVGAIIACIAIGGIMAFSGSNEIVRARFTATPTNRSLKLNRIGAPAALGLGIGMFLVMFIDRLS